MVGCKKGEEVIMIQDERRHGNWQEVMNFVESNKPCPSCAA